VIRAFVEKAIAEAVGLRERIPNLANSDDVGEKRQLLRDADDALAKVRLVGDAIVASFFAEDTATAREQSRKKWETVVQEWLSGRGAADAIVGIVEDLRSGKKPVPCFHWQIEFPEVFHLGAGGFDALVGNPPFLGGSRLSTEFGAAYETHLKASWPHLVGKIDLVVYFFHRAATLLRTSGAAAFIATYRVADGANALVGLRPFTIDPWMIYWAYRERRWPGAAKTRISQLAFRRRSADASFILEGRSADHIGCDLRASTDLSGAKDLPANEDLSFLGAKPDSLGFMLSDEERSAILASSPGESAAIRRYIIGNDLTKRPLSDGSRWIIDFSAFDEETARGRFPRCYEIVAERVRPSRMALRRSSYRDRWWQFTEPQTRAHEAGRQLSRVLGISRVTKYVIWQWIDPPDVIAFMVSAEDRAFGVLHSSFHEYWALRRGGKFGAGGSFRYSPTVCFRSFPFPEWTDASKAEVEGVAARIWAIRSTIATRDSVGLTEIYNRFHDRNCDAADVEDLRSRHEELDHAVSRSYGWSDLDLRRDWHAAIVEADEAEDAPASEEEVWRYALGDVAREALLTRLLDLNAARANEKASTPPLGSTPSSGSSRAKRGAKASKEKAPAKSQGSLFGGEDE
jgi:hypothetical protein